MGLTVNTNVAALNAYRNLSSTQDSLSKSLEKLSSGYRINRAADDAAGLAISEGLKSQIGGLTQAARNAQDGISVVQTAEGSLTEVHSILQRLRDLAVQASNDSNNDAARGNITTEANQLVSELDRIGKSTNFNGTKLLDGSAGTLNFQVGADGDANSNIQVDLSSANVSAVAAALKATSGVTFTGAASAFKTALEFTTTDAATGSTAVTDVDLSSASITTMDDAVTALNADANFSANLVASVHYDATGVADGISVVSTKGQAVDDTDPGSGADGAGNVASLDFSSHGSAQAAITLIDSKINSISTARANLGAYQNRFEHTINSVNVAVENLTASNSRISDTDMASEMVNFTRAQILQQAGTAMLAQANSLPQSVLKLLG